MRGYKGVYKIKNKNKYKGDSKNIIYRSLKERSIMKYLDLCDNVIEWSSEEIVVPYFFQVDEKMHRYFVDFYCKIKNKNNISKKYLLEYKPSTQTKPPAKPKRNTKKRKMRYLRESVTFIKNKNKWDAASEFAKKNDMKFYVITENHIKKMNFFKACIAGKY